MMSILIHWFVSALVLMGTAYLLPGFEVRSFGSALLAAVIIGFANILVKPILVLLTLPITILTLGLFLWVINALILKMCAALTPGFVVSSWGSAFLGALIIAVLSALTSWLF
ncbi:MAG TPA: phage holin family protein [Pseudobdellovibrionaceae bacterium]|jgi:putative membrane protein